MNSAWRQATCDLDNGLTELACRLNDLQKTQLLDYAETLLQWNKTYNLTAVKSTQDVISRHLLDSLSILPWLDNTPVMDVGSGAGLPGLILAIARPEQQYFLIDSSGKRVRFLNHIRRKLCLDNVHIYCQRAENSLQLADQHAIRQVTSRAFAPLDRQLHWLQSLLQSGRRLLAMCGHLPAEHLKNLPAGLHCSATIPLTIPYDDAERHLVIIEKTGSSST